MAKWLLSLLLLLFPSLAGAQFDGVVIRDPTTGQGACVNAAGELCTAGGGGGGTVDQGAAGMDPWLVKFPVATTATATFSGDTCPGTGCLSIATTNPGVVSVLFTGTPGDGAQLMFERTQDGTTWGPVNARQTLLGVPDVVEAYYILAAFDLPKLFTISSVGSTAVRIRVETGTWVSGTMDVALLAQPYVIPDMMSVRGTVGLALGTEVGLTAGSAVLANIRDTSGDPINFQAGDPSSSEPGMPVRVVQSQLANSTGSPKVVGVTNVSTQIVAANVNRKGLIVTNTSVNAVSCAFATPVLGGGIYLEPGAVYNMNAYSFHVGEFACRAAVAGPSNVAVNEFE